MYADQTSPSGRRAARVRDSLRRVGAHWRIRVSVRREVEGGSNPTPSKHHGSMLGFVCVRAPMMAWSRVFWLRCQNSLNAHASGDFATIFDDHAGCGRTRARADALQLAKHVETVIDLRANRRSIHT